MYFYNRNTAVVNIHLSPTEPCPVVTRMYAWSNFLLLKDTKDEIVRPSCLFAHQVHSDREVHPSRMPNVMFHFLASGNVVGEVIRTIPEGDFLRRYCHRPFQTWIKRNIVDNWYIQTPIHQAHFLCAWELNLDKYFSLCIEHDEYAEEHREEVLDSRKWFNARTLELCGRFKAEESNA